MNTEEGVVYTGFGGGVGRKIEEAVTTASKRLIEVGSGFE
jgi:hypothetical protein